MEHILYETSIHVSLEKNQELRESLKDAMHNKIHEQSIKNKILLCLSEAVTNIVIHAQPKAKEITLQFGSHTHGWWINIIDDGESWDPTEHKYADVLSNFTLTENGRGTAILHSQCEQISYYTDKETKQNRLRLEWVTHEKRSKPTILIVEDDDSLRKIYTLYLDNEYKILTATNGYEAITLLMSNKIDLVLSDINMPKMSGLELRKELNLENGTDIIPFIFLTAFDNTKMQHRATQLGIDDYLIKPINKHKLISTINRVLERSQQIYQQLTERIDKSITSALTPELPSDSHNWKLCVSNRNTGCGGGDLLLQKSHKENLQLVIADIMGHDDSAKFFAHVFGGYLHGILQSHQSKGNSALLLEHLSNFALEDKLLSKITLTCCSVILSLNGNINIASAGHPPPLRISKTGIEEIKVSGMMPGLINNTSYQSINLQLEAGERIAIFTDGLFESADDEKQRAELKNSVTEVLTDTLSSPIVQAMNEVMAMFDNIAGTLPKDDVLLLLFERKN